MTKPRTPRPLSWKPKLNGEVYCSSACGSKCKRADFERATARAEALVKRLGSGWEPKVWENMGWHYSARSKSGYLTVHERWLHSGKKDVVTLVGEQLPDTYTAYLSQEKDGVGGTWTADADTPEEAIRDVVAQATQERDKISKLLVEVALLVPRAK
jgi:hypothetical protein